MPSSFRRNGRRWGWRDEVTMVASGACKHPGKNDQEFSGACRGVLHALLACLPTDDDAVGGGFLVRQAVAHFLAVDAKRLDERQINFAVIHVFIEDFEALD